MEERLMKKLLIALLTLSMLITVCAVSSSADNAAIDITDSIKVATYWEMMDGQLKIVRDDAYLMGAMDYTNDTAAADWKAPGTGTRTLTVTGTKGWTNYFNDLDFLIDVDDEMAIFAYPCIWQNITGPMTYEFTVEADGLYEFVVVGTAQIKEADVDNDAKDRGFCVSVDGGQKYQVNISDTKAVFKNYTYDVTLETAKADEIKTTNGVNTSNYYMGYFYGIEIELKAGKHQFEYWGLEFSGAEDHSQKTSSRLNYAGTYVQKAMTDAELETYVYPEVTTEEPTTKPETTKKPETTAAPVVTEAPTEAPVETTATPAADTTAAPAPAKKGCGSAIGAGVALISVIGAAIISKKRF